MEITLCLVTYLTWILSWLLSPIYFFKSLFNQKKVPPIQNKILFLSATKLAEKIRTKELKSEEIVKAYIERIKEVNPIINAVVEDRFIAAIEESKAIDHYLNANIINIDELRMSQPLLGVPLTVKESCSLKDCSIAVGTKLREGLKATKDGDAVGLLRKAGAIALLVSNTPELCLYWETNNLLSGRCNNPYNTSRTTAGSSGGEGALLGSAGSIIGIGSDAAGSIRLPAMFNGIFGHKPTAGTISFNGHIPDASNDALKSIVTLGPMTRYAEDLTLMMQVMSGPNASILGLYDEIDLKQINVFFMEEAKTFLTNVDSEIKQVLRNCVEHLESNCGATIGKEKFKMSNTLEIGASLLLGMDDFPSIIANNGKKKDNLIFEFLKSIFHASKYSRNGLLFTSIQSLNGFIPSGRESYYKNEADNLRKHLLVTLKDDGVFLYPTFHKAAFEHDSFLFNMVGVCYLSIFNLLNFPSTHVPLGLNKKGLPIGIQVIASPSQDKLCLAVAKELGRAYGGWVPPS